MIEKFCNYWRKSWVFQGELVNQIQFITIFIDSSRQVNPSKHLARVPDSATLTDTPSTVIVGI